MLRDNGVVEALGRALAPLIFPSSKKHSLKLVRKNLIFSIVLMTWCPKAEGKRLESSGLAMMFLWSSSIALHY